MAVRTRPTRAGWVLLAMAAVLLPASVILSYPELWISTFAVVATLLLGRLSVSRPVGIDMDRSAPHAVTRGDELRSSLTIGVRRGRTGPVTVRDTVTGGSTDPAPLETDVRLAPMSKGDHGVLRSTVRPDRRGPVDFGPAAVVRGDALGLFTAATGEGTRTTTLVRPVVHRLGRLPAGGRQSAHTTNRRSTPTPAPEDFVALRPYQPGDDPRHIHWPAVARSGSLMVRQYERPDESAVLVVLDNRADVHTDESFERAVEATASVAAAALDDRPVRVVTTGGLDSGLLGSMHDLAGLLDALAVVDTTAETMPSLPALRAPTHHLGLVVVITGSGARLGDRVPSGSTELLRLDVLVDRSTSSPHIVGFAEDVDLELAWRRALGSSTSRTRRSVLR